jgi:hypothetical protein
VRGALLIGCLAAVLAAPAPAAAADPLAGAYGGPYTTPSGMVVNVYTAPFYPRDDAVNVRWASFLDSLVHGPELADLTLVLAPTGQVQQQCGLGAYACYKRDLATIVAVGERVADGPTPEAVVAHEYGHHVAASRSNAPWNAESWGTKRWATAMGICGRVRRGALHPGDERVYYLFNPGEAFAESYRLLNETALHLPVTPWGIVSPTLQPSAAALEALRRDVLDPWTPPLPSTFAGAFARTDRRNVRVFRVPTPLDGSLTASLGAPAGTSFRVSIGGKPTASAIVCGARTTEVRVTRRQGYGAFTLTVTPP